ncbi:hypothetical protein MHH33_17825 [Paenisporosarcina sp. FSL H8-0542]|uniref:hypothetical protein n=1 Tax=Paenisporosarcina sp. FSL H8-0542 TaxID=2921401 RepID=UPI00315A3CC1
MEDKKNPNDKGLRLLLIGPNILMWVLFLGLLLWFGLHLEEIKENNRLIVYLILLGALLFVSIFGAFRNWLWIKEGKM